MQDNLTGEDLEDILEELATVIDLADERDQQTTESLQVVTLAFNRIAPLSGPGFIIEEQVHLDPTISACLEDIHGLSSSLVVEMLELQS